MAQFPPNFDSKAFEAAWGSQDPDQLFKVNALQGSFENVTNQFLEAGKNLCELEKWPTGDGSLLMILRRLKQEGVITEATRAGLEKAKESRDAAAHDYINLGAQEFHDAVRTLIQFDRDFIQDLQAWMRRHHP